MTGEATVGSISEDTAADFACDDPVLDEKISLSDEEFDGIQAVIKELTGIRMDDWNRLRASQSLRKRLRATNISAIQGGHDYFRQGDPADLEEFINAVTTNKTDFFREQHDFDFLAKTIIPEIVVRKANNSHRKMR